MYPSTIEEIQALEDTALCLLAAERCEGYVYAGVFHGRLLMHPPGLRTSVESLPDYIGNWNDCMRLVIQAGLTLLSPPPAHAQWAVVSRAPHDIWMVKEGSTDAHIRRVITEVATWVACQGREVAR